MNGRANVGQDIKLWWQQWRWTSDDMMSLVPVSWLILGRQQGFYNVHVKVRNGSIKRRNKLLKGIELNGTYKEGVKGIQWYLFLKIYDKERTWDLL